MDEDSRAVDVIGVTASRVELLAAAIEEAGRIFIIDFDALVTGFRPNSIVGTSLVLTIACKDDTYQFDFLAVAVVVIKAPVRHQVFFFDLGQGIFAEVGEFVITACCISTTIVSHILG